MICVVTGFLWASLLFYLLLGGADFGAGINEAFTRGKEERKIRRKMQETISPIWEANHMWLIIAIVILFVGFPKIYTLISTHLHIPLLFMLLGIIARGTAFTFRHYDTSEGRWGKVYSVIFTYASIITPFFLGVTAGAAVAGTIDTAAGNFMSAYVYSWLSLFSGGVGVFTICTCNFLASAYIIGQVKHTERIGYIRKARLSAIITMVAAVGVTAAGEASGVPVLRWLTGNAVGIGCIMLAFTGVVYFCIMLPRLTGMAIRVMAAAQIALIFFGVTYEHYPQIILLKNGTGLSLINDAAEYATIKALGIALLAGSVFILPFLFYLFKSFSIPEES